MSAHIDRALLLIQQSRAAEAESELLLALVEEPTSARAHAYLALSQLELGKKDDALKTAQSAVGLSPDEAFCHHIHAFVLHRLEREKEALSAVQEAIRFDPDNEDHFALLASIRLAQRDWPGALAASEQGLALNPEHVQSANLRSMALVRLGRKEEAMATVDFALERAPENALSHANQGWNCLHRNDPRRAQDHFREALRLDPELEYARQGMLEALKARNPVYRGMLAYFLWMGRQSGRFQGVFIVGTFFGVRFARSLAESRPGLGLVLWPLLGLFYLFIYLSWTSGPMFNLLLRFDRFGRLVLSREERVASNWFASCALPALACLLAWAWTGYSFFALVAALFAVLSICVAVTFTRPGKQRLVFAAATAAMTLLAGAGIWFLLIGSERGFTCLSAYFISFIGLQIVANVWRR
jgi:tetratricopeptide (TPR) repeat protein